MIERSILIEIFWVVIEIFLSGRLAMLGGSLKQPLEVT
jgi:hypothetical protein